LTIFNVKTYPKSHLTFY